jgi:hypothetical protein
VTRRRRHFGFAAAVRRTSDATLSCRPGRSSMPASAPTRGCRYPHFVARMCMMRTIGFATPDDVARAVRSRIMRDVLTANLCS